MLRCVVKYVFSRRFERSQCLFFRVRHSSRFSLGLLDPGHEGSTPLRNLGNCSFDTAWHFTRLNCLATLLREPRISHGCLCLDKHCFCSSVPQLSLYYRRKNGGDGVCLEAESVNTVLIIERNRTGWYRCAAIDFYTAGAWIESGPG